MPKNRYAFRLAILFFVKSKSFLLSFYIVDIISRVKQPLKARENNFIDEIYFY